MIPREDDESRYDKVEIPFRRERGIFRRIEDETSARGD